MTDIQSANINDLIADDKNANKGTDRGRELITKSLSKFGAGRSILIDKNGRIIAGNKTAAQFKDVGLNDVIIVETDGKKLVAVKRTDIDLDSPHGRELAIADNRTSEVSLQWDLEVIDELSSEIELSDWFTNDEMQEWEEPEFDDEPDSSAQEIDVDEFEFDCKCPKCGFEFIQQK